jgi:regulator of protease activity HflC (stomatin/prohibitin superfamily)
MKKFFNYLGETWRQNRLKLVVTFLVILFLFVYLLPHILIFVEPGEGAVKWRRFSGGTQIDRVYGEGSHLIWPWDKMYLYNLRTQEVRDSVDVLTHNGLTIRLDLSVRFYPNRSIVGLLHKNVGPDYPNIIVLPEIENVVRTVVGQYRAEEIYTAQNAIIERIVTESYREIEERFVNLDDVLIRRILLPEKIQNAIQRKVEQQQLVQEFDFRLQSSMKEAQRKRIEAEGISNYNKIIEQSVTDKILKYKGIEATLELAKSENAKVVVIGSGKDGLPLILGNQ